jgi:hypothetical protein
MCVTGPLLWNTTWLEVSRCGHPMLLSPRMLGVRAVDKPVMAVDMTVRKNLLRLASGPRETSAQDWFSAFSLIFFVSS